MMSRYENDFDVTGLWEGNQPVTGGFPLQTQLTWDYEVLFDASLNKLLDK